MKTVRVKVDLAKLGKTCAAVLQRHHVICHHGGHNAPTRSAVHAHRVLTQERGPHATPRG